MPHYCDQQWYLIKCAGQNQPWPWSQNSFFQRRISNIWWASLLSHLSWPICSCAKVRSKKDGGRRRKCWPCGEEDHPPGALKYRKLSCCNCEYFLLKMWIFIGGVLFRGLQPAAGQVPSGRDKVRRWMGEFWSRLFVLVSHLDGWVLILLRQLVLVSCILMSLAFLLFLFIWGAQVTMETMLKFKRLSDLSKVTHWNVLEKWSNSSSFWCEKPSSPRMRRWLLRHWSSQKQVCWRFLRMAPRSGKTKSMGKS